MTQSPTQPQPLALDALTQAAMLCTTMDALPYHPRASAEQKAAMREAASLVVASLRPRDPLEAVLAARFVSAHYHVMDDFRAAAQPNLPPALQLRYQARVIALCKTMDATLETFLGRQTAAPRRPAEVAAAVAAQPAPEATRVDAPPAPARAEPTPEAARTDAPPAPVQAEPTPEAAPASTPPRPVVEGRHARRCRERAERHVARAKAAGLAAGGSGDAMHKRLLAEVAARAAASMTALAA
jgi:hypothetical protein